MLREANERTTSWINKGAMSIITEHDQRCCARRGPCVHGNTRGAAVSRLNKPPLVAARGAREDSD